jgi:lipoate-protein ligase A
MRWRLIVDGPADGASNMAVDQALFESVRAGGRPVLRLYRWNPPCLSLGRNEPAVARFDAQLASARGIDIVRRATGGLAVYHDCELTYAVALPVGVLGRPRATYTLVNRALSRGLRRLDIEAECAATLPAPAAGKGTRRLQPTLGVQPCFQEATAGELLVRGRKLVGSAQRCEMRTILQHGSILIAGDQSEVLELEHRRPADHAPPACTGIEALTGRVPGWPELENAIAAGFTEECSIEFEPDTLTRDEEMRARALRSRFRSTEWTWRR